MSDQPKSDLIVGIDMAVGTMRQVMAIWQSTHNLRFKSGKLQQMWISNMGDTDWRDVPEAGDDE